MIYDIQSRNDVVSGATLIVNIREQDLDRKALYTIQEDKPDFILPFRYRTVNGEIEFVYQIGQQSKFQYLTGRRYPKEYAELWAGILTPLLDCGDWFLRPYSFVLDFRYLYCDKNQNNVSYVYIPSIRDCSNDDSLKEMAAEFSRLVPVTDPELENKVLRFIMMDFNPKAFLLMLKPYTSISAPVVNQIGSCSNNMNNPALPQLMFENKTPTTPQYALEQKFPLMPLQAVARAAKQDKNIQEGVDAQKPWNNATGAPGEIIIDIPQYNKPTKQAGANAIGAAASRNKKNKPPKGGKNPGGIFGRKKAARQSAAPEAAFSQPPADLRPPVSGVYTPIVSDSTQSAAQSDVTQSFYHETSGAWLRLIGSAPLPMAIDVSIVVGEIFTIGRYDSAVGKRQSSFEFEKMTKAVSRRHAAIERDSDGYCIVDLSSSAGTFIDGQKLPPNTPNKLQQGCRVSFGNCGVDYIWEQ